jgi:Fe2+ or Zn2+ uptake regulation protein
MKEELLLRAICAFENEGIADFKQADLSWFGTPNTVSRNISNLEKRGLIEKINLNGRYSRYKINKVLQCYKFIYNKEFNVTYKCILLGLSKIEEFPETLSKSFLERHIGVSHNTISKYFKDNILEDLDLEIIKLSLNDKVTNSEYGLIPMSAKKDTYKCEICGTENPIGFESHKHNICRRCTDIKRKEIDLEQWLYNKSFKRFQRSERIEDYNLTPEYIKTTLIRQNYICYYSKHIFDIYNKYYQPTIDRIDSTKGYIEGNIVICCNIVNTMKLDMSTKEFKDMITLLYNNLDKY